MTTTDTDQGIEIVYQAGLRRIVSRRFCSSLNRLHTPVLRQEIRDEGPIADRRCHHFLVRNLTKTPRLTWSTDRRVYLISTSPDHPGNDLPRWMLSPAAPIRHQDALLAHFDDNTAPAAPQDLVERTAYRPYQRTNRITAR
jgi:hypothetical protein